MSMNASGFACLNGALQLKQHEPLKIIVKKKAVKRARKNPPHQAVDIVCFSHLRWNFVCQRPQHLLSRAAMNRRVFFFEEPVWAHGAKPRIAIESPAENLFIATPHLPHGMAETDLVLRSSLDKLIVKNNISRYLCWYYTPMAFAFTQHLKPVAVAYDCMDELSHFQGAPREMCQREDELLRKADVVFPGGQSLFEPKRHRHQNIHACPSGVDKKHFAAARGTTATPADQAAIPGPRVGFFGVIDERLDLELVHEVARLRPDYHFVFIGPVVKIDPATLPQRSNIYYLGSKSYLELPSYLAGWDVAILPFARNASTRYISPTKTPKYLAAGRRVVSTSIRDVVTPYSDLNLVSIADSGEAFTQRIDDCLQPDEGSQWLKKVDAFLKEHSWDATWQRMNYLLFAGIHSDELATAQAEH